MTTRKYARELTDEEMSSLLATLEDRTSDQAFGYVVYGVMMMLNPKVDDDESVDPTEYTIPSEQWITLANAIQKRYGIGGALEFMNIGPSGDFKEGDK